VKPLSDAAVERLRDAVDRPDGGDRYDVHELLGRGGMGAVYRATDRLLGRDVALKVITTELEQDDSPGALEQEARVLAALEHPGIVAIHDAGLLVDGRPFYVMRLGARPSAGRAGRKSRGERLRRFLSVCDAVSFAHSRGVIHRDLKPANVMVGEFGEVVVLDWGVAKVTVDESVAPTHSASSPNGDTGRRRRDRHADSWRPEANRRARMDGRADVFALGAILRDLVGVEKVPRRSRGHQSRNRAEPDERYASVDAWRPMSGPGSMARRSRVFRVDLGTPVSILSTQQRPDPAAARVPGCAAVHSLVARHLMSPVSAPNEFLGSDTKCTCALPPQIHNAIRCLTSRNHTSSNGATQ
jgi:serine/threonine protein kinase